MTTPTNEELMTQLGVTAQQAAELVEYFEGVRADIENNMGIEYGNNANGSYTKFPEGTVEMGESLEINNVSVNGDNISAIWTLPYPITGFKIATACIRDGIGDTTNLKNEEISHIRVVPHSINQLLVIIYASSGKTFTTSTLGLYVKCYARWK